MVTRPINSRRFKPYQRSTKTKGKRTLDDHAAGLAHCVPCGRSSISHGTKLHLSRGLETVSCFQCFCDLDGVGAIEPVVGLALFATKFTYLS